MPRIGRPESNTSCGAFGAPGSVVDSGPPDRMMPLAPNAAISAGSWSQAQISQYTPSSRTRRAISCVYCAPKSRMRILSLWMLCIGSKLSGASGNHPAVIPAKAGIHHCFCRKASMDSRFRGNDAMKTLADGPAGSRPRLVSGIQPIVRRFLGDLDVVRMGFGDTGAGDLHELRLRAHVLDRGRAQVAHRGAQAADQLVDDVAQRAAVRHATLDAFGHQLVGVGLVVL